MPILNDIMDHDLLGPKLRAARAEGLQEGHKEGLREGERHMLIKLIEKRFGTMPDWAENRLLGMRIQDIETAALRLLDAATLEELLGR